MKNLDRRKKDRRNAAKEIAKFIVNQNQLNEQIKLALFGNDSENGVVKDVKEMRAFFDPLGGFGKVSIILLKGLILIGAAVGAIYVVLGFLKKIGK